MIESLCFREALYCKGLIVNGNDKAKRIGLRRTTSRCIRTLLLSTFGDILRLPVAFHFIRLF